VPKETNVGLTRGRQAEPWSGTIRCSPFDNPAASLNVLLFAEIIRINPFRFVGRDGSNTQVEVNHQARELRAVNQDNLGFDFRHVLNRVR